MWKDAFVTGLEHSCDIFLQVRETTMKTVRISVFQSRDLNPARQIPMRRFMLGDMGWAWQFTGVTLV
jgi:hypothetical protein